ncbi:hypothetical protein BG20_I2504, partial [Candidatus Nitrosarchaeum limnium BG20]
MIFRIWAGGSCTIAFMINLASSELYNRSFN